MVQADDSAGLPADPTLCIDLSMSLDTPSPQGQEEQRQTSKANRSTFGHFAFGAPSHNNAEEQGAADPLTADQFGSMVDRGDAPHLKQQRQRLRLGSLKKPVSIQPTMLSNLSSGESPVIPRKRARTESFPDDEAEASMDIPLDRRTAARMRNPRPVGLRIEKRIQGLEEEEDDIGKLAAGLKIAEPTMRKRIEKHQSYGPKMVDLEKVGEVLEEQAVDDLLKQCEDISGKLRSALGSRDGAGSYQALEGESGMATPEILQAACGPAAKYIKSYQLIGINFLLLLAREGVEGSILADEMGLGKTAQTICFLGCLSHLRQDKGPHLIICPASLLENWEREFQRWCPNMSVVSYYGANRSEIRFNLGLVRDKQAAGKANELTSAGSGNDDSGDSEDEGGTSHSDSDFEDEQTKSRHASHKQAGPQSTCEAPFNIMLTCYNLFERDSTEQRCDRKFLKDWKWSHLILDEAHAVKNSGAMRTVRLNRIAEQCKRRVMLTGTPLQNDLEELQNLLRFLMPKLFTAQEAEEIANVQPSPQGEEEVNKLAERMQNLLRPFVLRRLKTEVAYQLAPKKHILHKVPMTSEQAELYARAVADLKKDLAPKAACAGEKDPAKRIAEAGKVIKKLGQKKMGNAFVALRKIALHPLLARRIYTDDQIAEMARLALRRDVFGGQATMAKVLTEMQGYSDFELHSLAVSNGSPFSKFVLDEKHLHSSAKCCFLAKLLPELKESGSRPLIFSQWTMVLDILEWLLQCLKLPFVRLDGSTAVSERLTTVDMFNNSENGVFAFLLSTRAGGQGLNLTGADTVILHDVDFNPQIDRQAEDRCHRLGQTKPVTVIRLVTDQTVDEGIHALAERKLRLDAAVLDGITASSKQTKAADNLAMSELLQNLIAGDPAGKSLAEQDAKKEVGGDAAEAVPLEEEMAADCQAASTQTAKSNSSAERPDGDDDSDVVMLSPTSCLETSESSQKKAHEMNLATGSEEVQVPTQKQSKVQTIVAKSF